MAVEVASSLQITGRASGSCYPPTKRVSYGIAVESLWNRCEIVVFSQLRWNEELNLDFEEEGLTRRVTYYPHSLGIRDGAFAVTRSCVPWSYCTVHVTFP